MKIAAFAALMTLASVGTASAQSLLRDQIDNTLNNVQSMFGDDSVEHEVRRLSDRIRLLDNEQTTMLSVLEGKRQEREQAAQALQALGVAPPPPVLSQPVTVPPGTPGLPEGATCLMSLSQTPIACW